MQPYKSSNKATIHSTVNPQEDRNASRSKESSFSQQDPGFESQLQHNAMLSAAIPPLVKHSAFFFLLLFFEIGIVIFSGYCAQTFPQFSLPPLAKHSMPVSSNCCFSSWVLLSSTQTHRVHERLGTVQCRSKITTQGVYELPCTLLLRHLSCVCFSSAFRGL